MTLDRKLHLGCGADIKEGWINLDSRDLPGVDVVRNVLEGLPFDDNSFSYVYSLNFMEHIPQEKVIWLMNEIHRILAPGGVAQHIIPRAGTESFYQDPTHVSRWNPSTIKYFIKDHELWEIYKDYIKPWELLRNNKSMSLHKDLMDIMVSKC